MAFSRVLVAVDGSEASHKALRFAAELARPHGSELTLVCVVAHTPYAQEMYGVAAVDMARAEEAGRKVLAEAVEVARGSGLPVRTEVLFGPPAETLADALDQGDYGMLVVGSRGKGAVARVLIGSTSDRLVHICKKAVVVVH